MEYILCLCILHGTQVRPYEMCAVNLHCVQLNPGTMLQYIQVLYLHTWLTIKEVLFKNFYIKHPLLVLCMGICLVFCHMNNVTLKWFFQTVQLVQDTVWLFPAQEKLLTMIVFIYVFIYTGIIFTNCSKVGINMLNTLSDAHWSIFESSLTFLRSKHVCIVYCGGPGQGLKLCT